MPERVILAYSGGLDTSVILKWLTLRGYEGIAYIADVGQHDDLEAARQKALRSGASKACVEDLKEEFVTDYILPAFKAKRPTLFFIRQIPQVSANACELRCSNKLRSNA